MTRIRTREWSTTDYYAVLGTTPDAPPERVDARFRELAKELHPDAGADAAAQERFKQMSAAYAVLRDPGTRAAYDEFRSRVAEGALADHRPPAPERWDHFAPPRVPRRWPPLPPWLRSTIATVLVLLGVGALAWAAFGSLPAPTDADTPVAVQITLVIMAVKFLVCGAIVAWYPQLRARWHR